MSGVVFGLEFVSFVFVEIYVVSFYLRRLVVFVLSLVFFKLVGVVFVVILFEYIGI